jgi:hypothetical protein
VPGREHVEQAMLVRWLSLHPAWRDVPWFAVPNAARRGPAVAAMMKREGLRAGTPDLVVPVSVGRYGALFVEMKAAGGSLSDAQHVVLPALARAGNAVVVARGFEAAQAALEAYRLDRLVRAAREVARGVTRGYPPWWVVPADATDATPPR